MNEKELLILVLRPCWKQSNVYESIGGVRAVNIVAYSSGVGGGGGGALPANLYNIVYCSIVGSEAS